ncbi:MAG TPA: hypothetical protein PK711_10880 [Bacteroidales bacterium]|nr:hypothetical protein [Bacteroidales bacterium]HRZ20926.1 hypothetical protein [Bacteroidales bacterium]
MYDHVNYFRTVASTLKEFVHTPHETVFHRVRSIASLEEFLFSQKIIKKIPHLLVMDRTDSRLQDALSDNRLAKSFYSFYIVAHGPMDDFDTIETVNQSVKSILHKILSKMIHDKQNYLFGMELLDADSIVYSSIGPIGDNFIGVECSFTITEKVPLAFDVSNWNI